MKKSRKVVYKEKCKIIYGVIDNKYFKENDLFYSSYFGKSNIHNHATQFIPKGVKKKITYIIIETFVVTDYVNST